MVLPQSQHTRHLDNKSSQKPRVPSLLVQTAEDDQHHPAKKQKLSCIKLLSAQFWNSLSKTPLTRNALQELDTRNAKPCHSSAHLHSQQHWISDPDPQPAVPKRFARHGGPDLKDLRGYRIPTRLAEVMSSRASSLGRRKRGSQSPTKRGDSGSPSKSSATPNSTSTRSTGPYDRAFQQHLIDHHIYPDGYEYPDGRILPEPANLDEIVDALAQPRASLSPSKFSNKEFQKFKRADTHASKEREVTTAVIPIIEGNVSDSKCVAGEIPFTNLEHLTDGTIVPGNPDLYYGARPEQVARTIRRDLGYRIVPSTQQDLPIVPNFFLQVKGPDGSMAVASRQACYDGALGARAVQSLQSYRKTESQYDNNANTVTSIYHGGQLKMYTTHPIQPPAPGAPPEYVMTQIQACSLTGDADSCRKGIAAYRNAREWAKAKRDNAIDQAHENAAQLSAIALPLADEPEKSFPKEVSIIETSSTSQQTVLYLDAESPPTCEFDTSADELSEEFHIFKRPRSH